MKVFWAEHAIPVTATALSPLTSTLYNVGPSYRTWMQKMEREGSAGTQCRISIWSNAWLHWLSVGLVIESSLVRLPAGALSSQLGQLRQPPIPPG